MTGRGLTVSLVTTGVILALGAYCSLGPKPKPLSDGEVKRVVEYRVQIVVDSVRVRELEGENRRLARIAASQIGRAKKSDSLAAELTETADSLLSDAYRASFAIEKARAWQEAALTYRSAATAATMASKTKDSTLVVRDSQIMAKSEIVSTEQARRARAEARVAELEPLAMRADDCKIARFINCPSRKQAFVAGGVLTLSAVAIALAASR
jgi:hypothetical protein